MRYVTDGRRKSAAPPAVLPITASDTVGARKSGAALTELPELLAWLVNALNAPPTAAPSSAMHANASSPLRHSFTPAPVVVTPDRRDLQHRQRRGREHEDHEEQPVRARGEERVPDRRQPIDGAAQVAV